MFAYHYVFRFKRMIVEIVLYILSKTNTIRGTCLIDVCKFRYFWLNIICTQTFLEIIDFLNFKRLYHIIVS